jgi:hypothetical protein
MSEPLIKASRLQRATPAGLMPQLDPELGYAAYLICPDATKKITSYFGRPRRRKR